MSKNIRLKKGFEINLAGKAEKQLGEAGVSNTFAVKPTDFVHVTRPKLSVAVGDKVKAGDPVFYDNLTPDVKFTSPISGEIVEINRGAKRRLEEIKIKPDAENSYKEFKKHTISEISGVSRDDAQKVMCESGVWPNVMQRPFAIVAQPTDSPKSIYISGFDSAPLAAEYSFTLRGEEANFQAGVDVLKKFTSGNINLSVSTDREVVPMFEHAKNVTLHKVSGKHPAGNVGIQIHHIDPINKGDIVWTVSPIGVIQIGKLFLEGKYDASKMISVCGSEISNPKYYKTFAGVSVEAFIKDNLKSDNVRVVSGNPLTGEKIGKDGYLGFYHNQFTVLPEGDHHEFMGWIAPTSSKLSFHRAIGLFSFMNGKNKEYVIDTNLKGEERAFVQTGVLEKVLPMDIYPTYLLKSIIAEDYDEMEALGIYEVAEEDFALCEFVDVSKNPIQKIIRDGIDLLRLG